MTSFMHIAHSLAFNLGYVLGVRLFGRRVQLHRLPNSWVTSAVNVPARTGLLGVPDPLSVP